MRALSYPHSTDRTEKEKYRGKGERGRRGEGEDPPAFEDGELKLPEGYAGPRQSV